eukprot:TRINITY_DN4564_c2_g1_i1.p1 TRINITY_DN4564_c2_g1~~TRINITY_DN4564_c2_g1_i1.p1  ORF type:complete len:350 (+),score=74.21 TRINITY_DN4564_c2_g1_i1:56-1051(+)
MSTERASQKLVAAYDENKGSSARTVGLVGVVCFGFLLAGDLYDWNYTVTSGAQDVFVGIKKQPTDMQNTTSINQSTCTEDTTSDAWIAARQWQASALGEHSSVASFAKFSKELMAVSAPAMLLSDSQYAAIQEVNHAKICFGVASKILGCEAEVSPSDIPARDLSILNDKKTLMGSAAREVAIGETTAAIGAAVRKSLSSDENGLDFVITALETLLTDKSSHAALAWNTLIWADTPISWSPPKPLPHVVISRSSPLLQFGILSSTEESFIIQATYNEVIFPLAQSLQRRKSLRKEDFILPSHSILVQYGGESVIRVMDILSSKITSFSGNK